MCASSPVGGLIEDEAVVWILWRRSLCPEHKKAWDGKGHFQQHLMASRLARPGVGGTPFGVPLVTGALSDPGLWGLRLSCICIGVDAAVVWSFQAQPGLGSHCPAICCGDRGLKGGAACVHRSLPSAEKPPQALPGLPSAGSLLGRELHCAGEHCLPG